MEKHTFLSDEWLAAVWQIAEQRGVGNVPRQELVANLVVTDTPFDSDRRIHVGARSGSPEWGQDHRDDADVTVTIDYATAEQLFIAAQDPGAVVQAAMQAFMGGKIGITGDMTKLMAMQQEALGAEADPELYQAVREITE